MPEFELPFDPAEPPEVKDPAKMTPEERHAAALRAFYEVERLEVARSAALDYLAELAGCTSEELVAVGAIAQRDERALLGQDEEESEVSAAPAETADEADESWLDTADAPVDEGDRPS